MKPVFECKMTGAGLSHLPPWQMDRIKEAVSYLMEELSYPGQVAVDRQEVEPGAHQYCLKLWSADGLIRLDEPEVSLGTIPHSVEITAAQWPLALTLSVWVVALMYLGRLKEVKFSTPYVPGRGAALKGREDIHARGGLKLVLFRLLSSLGDAVDEGRIPLYDCPGFSASRVAERVEGILTEQRDMGLLVEGEESPDWF